jgi:demethylmenaquinone methyltransferase/2-methoxy-6-polyprenyl-1,4-benzoquinol methylase
MKGYYAARAAEYDRIYLKPERQADLRAIEAWLPPHFAGRHVLEVACGTGWWTRLIAPVAAHVLGLDAAEETLDLAASRVPPDRVRLVQGDAYDLKAALGADSGRFDAAFAGFWISHVPRRRRAAFLREWCAVLAPGARVVMLDNLYVPGSSTPLSHRDDDGDTWQLRQLADGTPHRVLKNFPEEAELRRELAGLGEDVSYRAWGHYWALSWAVTAA